jgi:hypothetical protein
MLFSVSYLFFILVPGWLLVSSLGIERNRLLLSIAFSIGIAAINLVIVRMLGIQYSTVAAITVVESILLFLLVIRANPPASIVKGLNPDRYAGSVFLVVLLAVGAYAWLAGPYLEVPADNWWHLSKINDVLDSLAQGPQDAAAWNRLWYAPNLYGYFIPALAASLWSRSVIEILMPLNILNTVLFCSAIYTFALYVFEQSDFAPRQRVWCAALTVVFFVLQFGVNVFSFVRYYVYAPALMNYLVYLASAALLMEVFRRGAWHAGLPMFIFLTVTAYLVHTQEFLFIVLIASLVIVVEFYNSRLDTGGSNRRTIAALFITVLAGWVLLWIVSYTRYSRANPLAYDTILPLEKMLPFLKNLYVADPTFQFYQVLGVWGIVVYALFFHALFRRQPMSSFLVAGMLAPFVTIFNPFFVDLFLRHNYPDVIWRVSYMIPLPFVGAYFFTRAAHSLASERGKPIRRGVGNAAVVAVLVVLIFPISTTFFESRFSRLYTVMPVERNVGHDQWQDVFTFLGKLEQETVITDQVTGYLVNALTPHYYRGHKFYGFGAPKIRRGHYDDRTFSEYAGSLVIVNQRDGGLSRTGRLSGHWPENILKLSRFYPASFLAHIESNPQKYKKIWDQLDIQVYEIQS